MTVLHKAEIPSRYAYFPTSGIAYVVTCFAGRESVEVGLIGREGLTASFSLLGPEAGLTRCMMQMAGTALRIPLLDLKELFGHSARGYDLNAARRLQPALPGRATTCTLLVDAAGPIRLLGSRRTTVTVAAGAL